MIAGASTTNVGMLFSDIEGSTRLLQQLGRDYGHVLLDHHALLRAAFRSHGGEERSTEGDSFFVTFPSAADAIAAALDGQRALARHAWPPGVTIRVRMGVHVGDIELVGGTIVGMAVHIGARIGSAAHGGQVLVSSAAIKAAGADIPHGVALRDLGEHQLKDIGEPIRLFQSLHDDLEPVFPAPRTQVGGRTNLPAQVSSFVGRETEVGQLDALLGSKRLLTLTGAGGVGKSRLALRVAAEQGARFPDGVLFVDLAPVADDDAVIAQFAAALGSASADDVVGLVGSRQVMFLLDNCEHVVAGVSRVVEELLRAAPNAVVLATSRERLGIHGETVWQVPALSNEDAIELLRVRACEANPGFELSDDNRATVSDVCDRLDALPLALELAAARLGSLTVEELVTRLDHRFRLLAVGARNAMPRQRTLEATVGWSYALLDATEQAVFSRLGVFVGGFSLEAADAVCGTDHAVNGVDQLVAKSLVVAEPSGDATRYRLLETMRAYTLDRLTEAHELTTARDAHLQWALDLAGRAEGPTWSGDADIWKWLARLDVEANNLRAAADWAVERGRLHDAVELAIRLFAWQFARGRTRDALNFSELLLPRLVDPGDRAIVSFIQYVAASELVAETVDNIQRWADDLGRLSESSRPWLQPAAEAAIACSRATLGTIPITDAVRIATEAAGDAQRANALAQLVSLHALMLVSWLAEDFEAASAAGTQALELSRAAGLTIGETWVGLPLARFVAHRGNLDAAWLLIDDVITSARRAGDTQSVAVGMQFLSFIKAQRGQFRAAADMLLSILDDVGDSLGELVTGRVHNEIAWYLFLASQPRNADVHVRKALAVFGTTSPHAVDVLHTAAEIARALNDTVRARHYLRDGIALVRDVGFQSWSQCGLVQALAGVRLDEGAPRDVATLLGTLSATQTLLGYQNDAYDAMRDALAEAARASLGAAAFEEHFARGERLDFDQAVAVAGGL